MKPLPSVRRLLNFTVWLIVAGSTLSGARAQSPAPISQSPLAHFRFDEGSGSTTSDTLGAFLGILSQGASFSQSGIAGSCLNLNGLSGSVSFGDVLPLTNTPFSVSVWFKTPPGDTTPEAVLFSKHRPWFENGYYVLLNGGGGTVAGYGGLDAKFQISSTVNDGQWHNGVLVVTGTGEVRFHLDGGPAVATAQGGSVVPSPADFMIGGADPGPPARRFNGLIDDVQIYGVALDQESIDFLHRHPGLSLAQSDVISFLPESGPVTNPATITLYTTVPGGQIRYSLDGSEPTATSTLYTSPFALQVSERMTLRARAFLNGFPASETRSATYEPDPGIRFIPFEEHFTNQLDVTLFTPLAGVSLRFTSDGSEPTLESAPYETPLVLTNATTLRARAFLNGFAVTQIITKTYLRLHVFGNDGIPDSWRQEHFGDGFRTDPRAGAETDADNDGSTNRQEYLAGTNPLDPASGFLLRVRAIPEVRFMSVPGQKYRILRRTSISDPAPAVLAEITADGPEIIYVDNEAGTTANPAFYFGVPVP